MRPGDFLLGVLDFFAVILPGSAATWIVSRYIPPETLRNALLFGESDTGTPDAWRLGAAFLLASYVLGHFVFMAGSRLDAPYDRWRKRKKPKSGDKAFAAADDLRKKVTSGFAEGQFSTLKWAKAYVGVQVPHARLEIDRLEADSKFFRGLVVVSIALALHFMVGEGMPLAGAAALALSILSYHRYRDQRWKMTELSYATAVIVHATKATGAAAVTGATADEV